MSRHNSRQIEDVKVLLKMGADGRGIDNIEKTTTTLLVDTYVITFDDGTKTTFYVTNGRSIVNIQKTSTDGFIDTYTISYNDNTTSTFEVMNGNWGIWTRGVTSAIGDSSVTISEPNISTTSIIEVFCQNASGTPIGINNIAVTSGQAVLSFDVLEEQTEFMIHIVNSTEHSGTGEIYTKAQVDALLAEKQDVLIEGRNIVIDENEISSTNVSDLDGERVIME